MRRTTIAVALALLILPSRQAAAQSNEPALHFLVGGQIAGATSSEFDGTDLGVGGLLAWHPAGAVFIGTEAEMNLYPSKLTVKNGSPYSRRRFEGLFGISVGPMLGRVRPFGTFRPGFVWIGTAPGPLACPAIFPPILSCELAKGELVLATEVGGGIELFPAGHAMFRVDLGDRMMRYPGPAIDAGGTSHNTTFYEHELRFTVGAGVRF